MQLQKNGLVQARTAPDELRSREETRVLELLDRVNRGFLDRDTSAILACFESEAVIFDLAPPLAHRLDREALAAWFKGWIGPVERKMQDFTVEVSADLAIAHGLYQVTATTADGHPASWWMRATICLRYKGEWKIVHEHTSVPFHMDGSFRAAIDLQPSSA